MAQNDPAPSPPSPRTSAAPRPPLKPVVMPPKVALQVLAICLATGDRYEDVIADAVTLHYDELVAAGTVRGNVKR